METSGIVIITVVVSVLIAYFIQERRRGKVVSERDTLRTQACVALSQLQGVESAHSNLQGELTIVRERLQSATNERERALGIANKTDEKILEVVCERDVARDLLRAAASETSRLGAELQVAASQHANDANLLKLLRADLERVDKERVAKDQALMAMTAEHASLEKERDSLSGQLIAQRQWIEQQTKGFEKTVLASAMQIMEERGKAFTETNKKEVDAVVAPFKDQLTEFRRRVDEIHSNDLRDRGALHQQILQLTAVNKTVSDQADRLVSALTITSKSTGDWGETILQRILEDSGLRVGKEYELQVPVESEDGGRLQPDAVIYLPEKRHLVIDSKVSNKAWTAYCAEKEESRRDELLSEHLASIRSHVKGLAAKNYSSAPEIRGADFVLMFVPVEAALLTALSHDDALYGDSYRSKIILVTPSTLMAVIKLVEGLWTFQKRKESADEIAEAGRKLYEKLTTFATTFVDVGNAIGRAQQTYEKAQSQLSTGKGNAVRLAQRMLELGVRPADGKTMPTALLLTASDAEDDDTKELAQVEGVSSEKVGDVGAP